MSVQIPLPLWIHSEYSFAAYVAGPNAEAVASLAACARGRGETLIYLWGESGLGKTHLLNACCQAAHEAGRRSAYLPLRELQPHGPTVLDGLEQHLDLLCLDDCQCLAGDAGWEQALFHAFNRLRDAGCCLVLAAGMPPAQSPIILPDLRSRLAWGLVLQLKVLDDEAKLAALSGRARQLGMEIPLPVGRFLLSNYPRDLSALWRLLDGLDRASLAAQRRLTIPFVKSYLARGLS